MRRAQPLPDGLDGQRRFMLAWRAFWAREGRPEAAKMAAAIAASLSRLQRFERGKRGG